MVNATVPHGRFNQQANTVLRIRLLSIYFRYYEGQKVQRNFELFIIAYIAYLSLIPVLYVPSEEVTITELI